jgi:hypothetical protein
MDGRRVDVVLLLLMVLQSVLDVVLVVSVIGLVVVNFSISVLPNGVIMVCRYSNLSKVRIRGERGLIWITVATLISSLSSLPLY